MMGPGLLTSVSAPGPIAIGPQYCVYAVHLSLSRSLSLLYFLFLSLSKLAEQAGTGQIDPGKQQVGG